MLLPVLAATTPFSFLSWSFDPGVIFGVYIAGWLYYRAIGSRRTKWFSASAPVERRQIICFYSGLAAVVFALISPLGVLADDYLLSAHMIQHLLITIIVPVLIYAGIPGWMYEPARRRVRLWRFWRLLTHPLMSFFLFQIPFSLAHAPIFYDLTLRYQPVHIAEHMWFLVSAFLIWWPIMAPTREDGKLPPILAVVFLFFQTVPGQLVGALITMADTPLYDEYAKAVRTFGMSVMSDQQAGGLIMWIGTGTLYLGALTYIFFRWVRESEASERFVGSTPTKATKTS